MNDADDLPIILESHFPLVVVETDRVEQGPATGRDSGDGGVSRRVLGTR
jgi:hypothetical protein